MEFLNNRIKWNGFRFLLPYTYSSFVLYYCQHKLTSSQAFCTIIDSPKKKKKKTKKKKKKRAKKLVHFILEKLNFQNFLNGFFFSPIHVSPKFPICSPRVFPIVPPYLLSLSRVCSKFSPTSQLYR